LNQAPFFAGSRQYERDIVKYGSAGDEFIILEYDTEFSAQKWDAFAGNAGKVHAIYQDLAFRHRFSQIQEFQQGGLSRSAWTGYKYEIIFRNIKGNINQGLFDTVIAMNMEHPNY
jgi:hypothetical protein